MGRPALALLFAALALALCRAEARGLSAHGAEELPGQLTALNGDEGAQEGGRTLMQLRLPPGDKPPALLGLAPPPLLMDPPRGVSAGSVVES